MLKRKTFIKIAVLTCILAIMPHSVWAASSNANLKNLGFTPNDFKGFKPSKTEYEVTVPEEVTDIEVYAEVQDGAATVEGTGDYELSGGLNKILVTVTAEDGTKKEYTINITKPEDTSVGVMQNQIAEVSNEVTDKAKQENVIDNKVESKVEEQEKKDTLTETQRMYLVIGLVVLISFIAILCAVSAYRNRYVEDDDYEEYDYEEALNRFKPIPEENKNPLEEIYQKKEGKEKEQENKETANTEREEPLQRGEIIDEFMNAKENEGRERKRGKGKHF